LDGVVEAVPRAGGTISDLDRNAFKFVYGREAMLVCNVVSSENWYPTQERLTGHEACYGPAFVHVRRYYLHDHLAFYLRQTVIRTHDLIDKIFHGIGESWVGAIVQRDRVGLVLDEKSWCVWKSLGD
jgi:hypothetical protein